MTFTLTDQNERDLLEAYNAADHMPQGTMTGEQWAVFAKLHIAVGRIVDATFESRPANSDALVAPPIPEGLCGVDGCTLSASHTMLRGLGAQLHTWER